MKKMVFLPFGDQSHIDKLLEHLGGLAGQGREREFALLLPSSQLLHEFRRRLVQTACRKLNLTTFDDLVQEAVSSAASKSMDVQTAAEVVARLLAVQADKLPRLGRYAGSGGMARDLVYVLSQLRRAKITPADLERVLTQDPDQVLTDLLNLWREYQAFMMEHGLADIEGQYALAAGRLAQVKWLKDVREFHVCWFSDFEPQQLDILAGLSAWGGDITVWLPYAHSAHAHYLNITAAALKGLGFLEHTQAGRFPGQLAENLFCLPAVPCDSAGIKGLAAPRLKQELALVAREIKKLSASGAKPGDICLVVPDQRKYLPLMRRAYREEGIDLSMPWLEDLAQVPWVKELLAVWQGAEAGWDMDSLLTAARNVYITAHLPQDYDGDAVEWALNSLGGNLRGRQWLGRLDQEIERLSRPDWLQAGTKTLNLYRQARPGLEAWLLGPATWFTGGMSPREHCELMSRLLGDNAETLNPSGDSETVLRDRAAWTEFSYALKDYLACCALLGQSEPISPGAFAESLRPWLERGLALERTSPGAVRVLSPAEIRGISSAYVFVVGMNQGTFPHFIREHWLLDRMAELPGLEGVSRSSALEQEKLFFHACVAAARDGLYLSRQLPGAEAEAEISSFWREAADLLKHGLPEETLSSSDSLPKLQRDSITAPRHLVQRMVYDLVRGETVSNQIKEWLAGQPGYAELAAASRAEQRRESPLPADNMDGALSACSAAILARRFGRGTYSISRLEQYARCPFSFFARYVLELEAAPGDIKEFSALDRGALLHWLLEQYYSKHLTQADATRPETIRQPLAELARRWLELQGHTKEDVIWILRTRDAVDTVQILIESDLSWLERTGLKPQLFEASFGLPGSAVGPVNPGGGRISFHGIIDRIDIMEQDGETWAVVYDYKTSRGVTQKDIVPCKSLQIPVYLAAAPLLLKQAGFGAVRIMGGGYYAITKAKLEGGIWNKVFTSRVGSKLGSLEQEDFDMLEQTLARVSGGLHDAIISGRFVPGPDASACTWCEYTSCCRWDKNRFKLKAGGEDSAEAEC